MSGIAYNLYVRDENGAFKDEVFGIESLQWLEEYSSEGEIKLVCAKTAANENLLHVGARLWLKQRPHLIAILDTVQTEQTSGKSTITARGEFSVCAWKNRIVPHVKEFENANAEQSIINVLSENKRGLPCTVNGAQGFESTVSANFTWKNAFEIASEIAKAANLGIKHIFNEDGTEMFTVYTGTDRTNAKSENYIGCFSESAGNISKLTLQKSDVDYKNTAYVCSSGNEAQRTVEIVDLSDGQQRREMYVNADDISEEYRIQEQDGTYTTGQYTSEQLKQLLRARGVQELTAQKQINTLSAQIEQKGILFGKHYDLGDIVPLLIYTPQKTIVKARITSVQIIMETHTQINAILEVSL